MPGTVREKENGPDRAAGGRVLSLHRHEGEFHSSWVVKFCGLCLLLGVSGVCRGERP